MAKKIINKEINYCDYCDETDDIILDLQQDQKDLYECSACGKLACSDHCYEREFNNNDTNLSLRIYIDLCPKCNEKIEDEEVSSILNNCCSNLIEYFKTVKE